MQSSAEFFDPTAAETGGPRICASTGTAWAQWTAETGSRHLCQHWQNSASTGKQAVPAFVPALAQTGFNGAATVSADSHLAFMRRASQKTVYIPSMAPRNHAACIGDDCDAGEIIAGRPLLAQFGLTPKSKRGLAAREAGEAVDPLDAL